MEKEEGKEVLWKDKQNEKNKRKEIEWMKRKDERKEERNRNGGSKERRIRWRKLQGRQVMRKRE
jgi:hypothetical protein